MSKKEKEDFRSYRAKLSPDCFLMAPEGPNPPPEDLIEKETWGHLIWLTDDVSLRTSDNHGSELKIMYELYGSLIDQLEVEGDVFWELLLDIADEFQASLFNLLCGFYRVSLSCLRSALEISTYALYFQVTRQYEEFKTWIKGKYDDDRFRNIRSFGNLCDQLDKLKNFESIQTHLNSMYGFTLFNQKTPRRAPGITRQLHSHLSKFVHSRPQHTHGDLWKSTGPVYVPISFVKGATCYLETFMLVYVFIKLARPETTLNTKLMNNIFSGKLIPGYLPAYCVCLLWPEIDEICK